MKRDWECLACQKIKPEEAPTSEPAHSEDIPEDTPHYLNPEVMARDEVEQDMDESAPGEKKEAVLASDNILATQPPEKIETVLNSGMQFMAGLMEMATGQNMEATGDKGKMININRDTGEVTMKFKLPGF